MTHHDSLQTTPRGRYRDVLRGPQRGVVVARPPRSNAIVADCRRVLAGLLGPGQALGIQGLAIGAGLSSWDGCGAPRATPAQTKLVDPKPYVIPASELAIDFIEKGRVTKQPTNELQIRAKLGADVPPWPDRGHRASSLREFGLLGQLGGAQVLINYVTHPVIHKDRDTTLERTIWLVF
ncbi:MAG: hypothetical protein AAF682_04070 [Planctomycetota bacterium]